jgi:ubiquinone/menaquinone biosynthesis C-methylase UbiE
MKYNWLLDEVSSAGRENLDATHAASYDRKEDASAEAERELLIRIGLSESSEVIDVGAGTGQFTMAVAPACARIVAVNVSPIMLDILRMTGSDRTTSHARSVVASTSTSGALSPAVSRGAMILASEVRTAHV